VLRITVASVKTGCTSRVVYHACTAMLARSRREGSTLPLLYSYIGTILY